MTEYTWVSVSVPLFDKKDLSPEVWAALEASVQQWQARMSDQLNRNLYPYPGARDEAVARLNRVAGL